MSLYLKYRPKDFESLVGQNFIKTTLQKAVQEEKTVWAYLFCWPRWTGKTSSARILAKAINCLNPKNWNPCNKCEICNQINEEKLIDIIEIDAASHTWVDNIREIIEKAKFSPTKAKFKIYIIDEVHMLSKWAFNALLKILEEPEKHVKFILATTETHKVPETIISRCQRYDFKNISLDDIKNRLNFIARQEKISIDEQSLDYISKSSSWGLRNAISLFEQLIIDNKITFKDITSNLWIVEESLLESFLERLLNKDKKLIKDFEELINSWKNIKLFFKQLIFFAKEKAVKALEIGDNISSLIEILDSLNKTYSETKNSLDESTTFLIWVLKIINNPQEKIPPQTSSLNKIEQWQKSSPSLKEDRDIRWVPKREIKKEKSQKSEENINSINELNDIFWNTEKTKNEKSSFDKENFIENIKKSWGKPWLTMSIRWAEISLDNENLYIKFKTTFALKEVQKSENTGIITSTLESMWLEQIKVNFS